MTGPGSSGPIILTVITQGSVSASALAVSRKAARNFPSTTSPSRTGSVVSSSRVPDFRSSAMSRMVIAGARITSSIDGENGDGSNRLRMSARPMRNTVEKNIQPETSRKAVTTM
jgi:hypothetical protein